MILNQLSNLRIKTCLSWIYERFCENFPLNFTKDSIFEKRKFASPFSLHLFHSLKPAYTIARCAFLIVLNNTVFLPQSFRHRPLIIP